MSTAWLIAVVVGGWIVLVALARLAAVRWSVRRRDKALPALLLWILRAYARWMHNAQTSGMEQLRDTAHAGPLLIVSNHTGSVDPLLIQSACRFHITWLMAADMLVPALGWLQRHRHIIPVDRTGRDTRSIREAIRQLQAGRAVGIFPEGRIVYPPQEIRPFHAGVGVIIARSKAPVLLVWVSGTPVSESVFGSLFTRSNAHVHFAEVMEFDGERDPEIITEEIRKRLSQVSGWPVNDLPLPPSRDSQKQGLLTMA